MSSSNAAMTALSIPEILVMILLKLDMRTLIWSQRTCRSWFTTIKYSTDIQKALFFTPIEKIPNQEPLQNSMLGVAFPALFDRTDPNDPEDKYDYGQSALSTFDMIKNPQKLEAYLRPEASWRRMLVQQPPAHKFAVLEEGFGMGHGYRFFEIPSELNGFSNGLRMGDFFEELVFGNNDWYARCNVKRVIWWCRTLPRALNPCCEMKEVSTRILNYEIVVWLRSYSNGCTESDDEGPTQDEAAMDRIKAAYRETGIQPKLHGMTGELEDLHLWD
ncbi:hypothetical protein Asppvi_005368 [Aspergillus pseudoviridinutans]|uniref:F-box domain-containing protein n=1 Tax=Aspergillus pseudoviridinutans TaxID=1517512 RepID=A0A9P3BAQ4_9EURO|nr:uncharacterized protein Asppvi_005368 [Aspergillus pseudoviridinutans]GIJ86479.1 hypothetical protein Asppvi_005368 [Aspergillus pseudoviridinutans]